MIDGVPSQESIQKAIDVAKQGFINIKSDYHGTAYCYKYLEDHLTPKLTQARLDAWLKQAKRVMPTDPKELAAFNACMATLRAAGEPDLTEPVVGPIASVYAPSYDRQQENISSSVSAEMIPSFNITDNKKKKKRHTCLIS